MAQIFHPSTNTISKVTIFGSVFAVGAVFLTWGLILRSPYVTQDAVAREQPVPFSHEHHVSGLGIDCRYCHTSVEEAAFAGMPSTKTCMTCHSQIWTEAEVLAMVRTAWRRDESIPWKRVHDLPDFTYFDHSIHLKKGIGCSSCHGRVDQMPLMWRENSLLMEWCIDCHRDPVPNLRPREDLFDMSWTPARISREEQVRLAQLYEVESMTDCYVCHR